VLARDERSQPTWYLMEFIGDGMLHDKLTEYQGNAAKTLRSILPVVRALGRLHQANLIHRDVKTKNIFLRTRGDLVLGDLGIVYDSQATRLTTYESPMSRDWTPRWRPEELDTPTRDIYSMARVIYAMLTGDKLVEPHWLDNPDCQLEHIFPGDAAMPAIDKLLRDHIVARRDQCASIDGAAFAVAVEAALETVLVGRQMMPVVLWGSGFSSPGSGSNRSLDGLPILLPPWTRRLSARLRYRHQSPQTLECTFDITLEDGKTKLQSPNITMIQHNWAATSIDVPKRPTNDWCLFSLRSDYVGLISEFSLYALSY
jgi:serine/threonine protein kinase